METNGAYFSGLMWSESSSGEKRNLLWAIPRLTLRAAPGLSVAALRVTSSFEGIG